MKQIIVSHFRHPDSTKIWQLYPNFTKLSMGLIIRHHLKEQTSLGKKAKAFMDQGEIIPNTLIFDLLEDYLEKFPGDYLLSAFPRNIEEAIRFLKLLPRFQYNLWKVYVPQKERHFAFLKQITTPTVTDKPSDQVFIQERRKGYIKEFEEVLIMVEYLKTRGIAVQTISFD